MDYEKKYRESLEHAKTLYENANGMILKKWIEQIFPELRESEDERISREITEFILTHRIDEPNDIEDTNSWLVWLEKQGEKPKKVSIWKHWKDGIAGGTDEQVFLIKTGNIYSISSCLGCECDYIALSELDKLMREEKQDKPKWSEEDDYNVQCCIAKAERDITNGYPGRNKELIEWLKQLKQRMEEQQ